jgi:predicted dehydrogenase
MRNTARAGVSVIAAGKVFGQDAPSNTVRLAVMGCHKGGRGIGLMKTIMGNPGVEIATVCDVDSRALADASAEVEKRSGKAPKTEGDIRKVLEDKSIDGVICACPAHWHATAALMAMKAGKAIYVEKPIAHNPREGEILLEAAKKYNAILQVGTQRRSSPVYHEVINNLKGLIGEPRFARAWYARRRGPIGKGKVAPVPGWLNWDLWQGPAPRREYLDNLVHYNWHWRWHWGTGESGNNATHMLDLARWALGVNYPQRATSGGGRFFYEGDDWEAFDTQTATFEFPERKCITWEGLSSLDGNSPYGIGVGLIVYGLDGSLLFESDTVCKQFDKAGKEVKKWTSKDAAGSYDPTNSVNPTAALDPLHLGKWLSCVRNKTTATAATADTAHKSALLTQLANIAQRTGETIRLDSATGQLAPNSPGKELWAREYEKGWEMTV